MTLLSKDDIGLELPSAPGASKNTLQVTKPSTVHWLPPVWSSWAGTSPKQYTGIATPRWRSQPSKCFISQALGCACRYKCFIAMVRSHFYTYLICIYTYQHRSLSSHGLPTFHHPLCWSRRFLALSLGFLDTPKRWFSGLAQPRRCSVGWAGGTFCGGFMVI